MKAHLEIPTIALRAVGKEYAPRSSASVRALQAVDLELPPGSFLSVAGPSGCGKTTLLNLLGLIDRPSTGAVLWDGRPVGALRESERARLRLTRIGFIFQRFYLLPTLTARENVELPMRALGVGRAERHRRSVELLEQVGLGGRAEALPSELSGGEEQRVAIARSLANGPGLLLADEPTGELDSRNAAVVLELLARAQAETGATVVLVTHNPEVASRARRHLTMHDGRVVADEGGT